MNILVFSDIHGNIVALNKMIEASDFDSIDACIYCGDSIGYFPYGEQVVDKLRNLPDLISVKGNHDLNLVEAKAGNRDMSKMVEDYGISYSLSYSQSFICYMGDLPNSFEIEFDGISVGIMHGTPDDCLNGRLYPDSEPDDLEPYEKYDLIFCGHTHYKMDRSIGTTRIINPGSLGLPRDGGLCSYAIFNTESGMADFREIEIACSEIEDLLLEEPNSRLVGYIRRKFSI